MCGECLDGCVGEAGSKNSYCFYDATYDVGGSAEGGGRRALLAGFDLPSSVGSVCATSNDCQVARWEECVDGACAVVLQACVNDCSGRGNCSYVSITSANITYESCTILDFNCRAMCKCPEEYYGWDCSLSYHDWLLARRVRHGIAVSIRNISATEDLSPENLVSWINGLASLTVDPTLLTQETKVEVVELATSLIGQAAILGMSFEEISGLPALLDFILQGASADADSVSIESGLSAKSGYLLKLYSEFVSADMSPGQNPVRLISGAFRMMAVSLEGRTRHILPSPQSRLEYLFANARSEAQIDPSGRNDMYKVILLERIVGNASAAFLSLPFGLDFDMFPCNTSLSQPCVIHVVLQHAISLPLMENYTEDVSFACRKGFEEEHEYVCANGLTMTAFCNGSASGTLYRRCPTYHPASSCESMGTFHGNCTTLSYTATNATCQCALQRPLSGRRLQSTGDDESPPADDSSVSVDFVAAADSILVEFVDTWRSAGDLSASDVKKSWRVLVTVSSIGVVSIAFILLGWWMDLSFAERERKETAEKKKVTRAMEVAKLDIQESVTKRRQSAIQRVLSRGRADSLIRRKSTLKMPTARERTKSFVVPPEQKTVVSALPIVLQPLPLWKKYLLEAQVYHR